MSSENPSAHDARDARDARAKKRIDYRQLNDGSDYEADIADRMGQPNIASIE